MVCLTSVTVIVLQVSTCCEIIKNLTRTKKIKKKWRMKCFSCKVVRLNTALCSRKVKCSILESENAFIFSCFFFQNERYLKLFYILLEEDTITASPESSVSPQISETFSLASSDQVQQGHANQESGTVPINDSQCEAVTQNQGNTKKTCSSVDSNSLRHLLFGKEKPKTSPPKKQGEDGGTFSELLDDIIQDEMSKSGDEGEFDRIENEVDGKVETTESKFVNDLGLLNLKSKINLKRKLPSSSVVGAQRLVNKSRKVHTDVLIKAQIKKKIEEKGATKEKDTRANEKTESDLPANKTTPLAPASINQITSSSSSGLGKKSSYLRYQCLYICFFLGGGIL